MKVLIVEDSSFILLVCKQALEKSGHEVFEALNGMEAIEKAQELRPDLVIMDIALPRKNGFEATAMILKSLPTTKVLAISAIDEAWVKKKALESGCFDFLAKPFQTEDLLSSLEQVKNSPGDLKYG